MSDSLNLESLTNMETNSKTTVLLVDEDIKIGAAIQDLFRDFFRSNNYRVIQATTLTDALEHLEKYKIDLVITDLRLSRYSGLSLLVRVRAMPYEIPIIVMSAFTDFMSEEDWKLLGVAEFISKPPDLKLTQEIISKVLNKKIEADQSQPIKEED